MDTTNIIQNIAFGDFNAAKNAINSILLTKTAEALDEKKKEIAQTFYSPDSSIVEDNT